MLSGLLVEIYKHYQKLILQFFILSKTQKYFYFLQIGHMWLIKKLVFNFSAPLKYDKTQFNLIILSRVIMSIDARPQIDTFVKTIFF